MIFTHISLFSDKIKISPTGLIVESSPDQDEWIKLGAFLVNLRESIHWLIGDWINYGMDHYVLSYEKASQLLEECGFVYSNQTLRIDKYVSSRIPLLWRHNKLSWQHHREVAALEPEKQKYWLSFAHEMSLTTKELRDAIGHSSQASWLCYTDVWDFEKYDKRFGVDSDTRIPAQIIQNLLFYYSRLDSFIVDPIGGDGTTFDVCTNCKELKRRCLTFDVLPVRSDIIKADATKPWPLSKPADLIFMNATSKNILRLGRDFGGTLRKILGHASFNLKLGGILSVIIEPISTDEPGVDWSFKVFQILKNEMGLRYKRKIMLSIPPQNIDLEMKVNIKKNTDLISQFRELIIFQKSDISKCFRCGIRIGSEYHESKTHHIGDILYCNNCWASLNSRETERSDS